MHICTLMSLVHACALIGVVLCCVVLCCAVLCCVVLCCVLLCCVVLCCVVLCCVLLCCAVLCCVVLCCVVLCCVVLCCVVLCCAVLCCVGLIRHLPSRTSNVCAAGVAFKGDGYAQPTGHDNLLMGWPAKDSPCIQTLYMNTSTPWNGQCEQVRQGSRPRLPLDWAMGKYGPGLCTPRWFASGHRSQVRSFIDRT